MNGMGQAGSPGMLFLVDALGTLRSLVDAIVREPGPHVLGAVLKALMEHQEFDGCALYLRRSTPDETQCELRVVQGLEPPLVELAGWLARDLLRAGALHLEPDLARRGSGLSGSLMLLAVRDQSATLGVLAAWSQEPLRFQAWHQSLLELFCDVLGLYLRSQSAPGCERRTPGERRQGCMTLDRPGAWLAQDSLAFDLATTGSKSYEAALDPLTGLLSRTSFEARLDRMLREAPGARPLYLYYIDIDRYRLIRQLGGDRTAEQVIRIIADTLRRLVGHELALARLGGDELGVLAEVGTCEGALALAQRLVGAVDALRMSHAGQRFDVSVSIGVASLDASWDASATALRQAREACAAAARQGGGTVQLYAEMVGARPRLGDDGLMLNQLTRALKEDRLLLYAQPILAARAGAQDDGQPAALYELLVRMRDRRGGVFSASAFLPLAERYGLSLKLDRWVVRESFRVLAQSGQGALADAAFAINLSGHSIDDQGLLGFIMDQFEQTALPPGRVCFEITETAAISDIEAARNFMQVLKDFGCKFALDDFGSGHSSFLYLRDFPVDYLKIDGNLVREITRDPVSLAFVRSIDDIGKIMGKLTIAEHVESEDVLETLAEIGVDYAQGYYLGRPEPLGRFLK